MGIQGTKVPSQKKQTEKSRDLTDTLNLEKSKI